MVVLKADKRALRAVGLMESLTAEVKAYMTVAVKVELMDCKMVLLKVVQTVVQLAVKTVDKRVQ